ncbi:MAG TPA: carboxypeptidase regulatory-like domain-containing protein [Bacteroidetes bacterium]|nr:carboxypeptidase regulatory-like domain-containing protein [Bacteroidota bacterium]
MEKVQMFIFRMKTGLMALLLAAWVFPGVLPAQNLPRTYTVRGQILSLTDNLPIPGIEVYLKGTEYTAVTDSMGNFSISGVPPGVYDVIARYPDFDATVLRGVQVPPRARQEYVFNLQPRQKPAPLPFIDMEPSDSLGILEGTVIARIDTFKSYFKTGYLQLKAVKRNDLTRSYYYPVQWDVLPVAEQEYRFRFVLPRGQTYHLYVVWRSETPAYIEERILDVARKPENPRAVRRFDLRDEEHIRDIEIQVHTGMIELYTAKE